MPRFSFLYAIMSLKNFIRKTVNFKFRYIQKSFGDRPFTLLDVGAGNHSASSITSVFPHCSYYGLDLDSSYNNDEQDIRAMKGFFQLDLTRLDYSAVPDAFFDGIVMAHVIEHLHNGDKVLPLLMKKLKPGGYFYIEYPGEKSLHLPSMRGTLNFKDDTTHVRVYSVPELKAIFEANEGQVLQAGTRRNGWYIAGIPVRILESLIKKGYVQGNTFWDLLGFAEYLWVKKKG